MHRAGTLACLAMLMASGTLGCASDEPIRPATSVPAQATIPRPVLVTASVVVSPVASPSPVPAGESYTVQAGDNLTSIAARFYGDAGEWRTIFEANRDQLSSPDGIQVGMRIRIPPRPRQ
jgi:nucleoid-associated protein YgaU